MNEKKEIVYEQLGGYLNFVAGHPDVVAINSLFSQLSSQTPDHDKLHSSDIQEICRNHYVFVARKDGAIVGIAILVVMYLLGGRIGWVEDVAVDELHRRQGIARGLISRLIECATIQGCKHLNLTSKPERVAANELYRDIGFLMRQTNVYRRAVG